MKSREIYVYLHFGKDSFGKPKQFKL